MTYSALMHPAARRLVRGPVVLFALFGATPAAGDAQVPAEYQGSWAPAKASCESPPRVIVSADKVTLVNGADRQEIGGIEMAGPGYFAPDYTGILAVLITEFDGQQPVTMMFNVGEKQGVAQAEFSPVMPGGNPQAAAYNARISQLNLARRFPLNKVTLKKCGGEQGPGAGAVPATPASVSPAAPARPSICAGNPHCVEVTPFAATVTDFRTGTSGATKVVTVSMRFQNRTSAPLILGYVQGSGIVTDDRGNRYTTSGQGAIRGIGEINNSTFDSKFTLQPGEASDARMEFQWTPQRGQILGTTYDVELAVRQVDALEENQYQLGKEYALKLDGFTGGAIVASARSQASDPVARDACAGQPRCYGAGPFAAEVTQVTTSKVTYYVYVHLNVKVLNVTTQPLVLGWQSGSGVVIDDAGKRYAAKSVKGIGLVTGNAADPQFALNPGQSRAFTIDYVARPGRAVVGTRYTADFVLQQLEILPSRQVRTLQEYSVSYQDLAAGNTGAAGSANASNDGAAPASGPSDSGVANAVNATAGAVKAVGKLFRSK